MYPEGDLGPHIGLWHAEDWFVSSLRFVQRFRTRLDNARERGAVLALVAATLVLVLISGAVAVDLSALDRQGQSLQNTADAAALAGVATWVDTGDQAAATAVVTDLILQNGVALGDGVTLDVEFPTSLEIQVNLVDDAPEVFFGDVVGFGDELERDATAQLEVCDEGCNRVIEVPPPFNSVLAQGTGDGYIPIAIEDKLYAVNHHSFTIECVDRETNAQCWSEKQLFDFPVHTFNVHHPFVHGTKIFYLGWGDGNYSVSTRPTSYASLYLGCFDTATDTRCSNTASMYSAGFGTMYGTADGIYVFSGDRKVYCFDPDTLNSCSGYSGGKNTALSYESGWGQWWENRSWNADRIEHDNKIYVGLTKRYGGTWVQCWDMDTNLPCSNFSPRRVNGTSTSNTYGDWVSGRLFLFRESDGTPRSLCSIGNPTLFDCWYLSNGNTDSSAESSMNTMASSLGTMSGYLGRPTYHAASNRLFLVGDYYDSNTHCYNFNNGGHCGSRYNTSPWGEVKTYGYTTEGNCLLGLGHNSIFFSLQIDMSGECTGGSRTVDITPCMCGDVIKWPPITATNLDYIGQFDIRVIDPDGNVLIPADGEGWVSILTNPISLEDISTDFEYLTLELAVEPDASGNDPWATSPPSLLIGIQDKDPRLVE